MQWSTNLPIYEYECRACGHEFEAMQKFSDPVLVDCPDCAKPTLKKLISPVAFRLKGTGWYETDFKNTKRSADTADKPIENGGEADKLAKKEDGKTTDGSSKESEGTSSKAPESNERSGSSKA